MNILVLVGVKDFFLQNWWSAVSAQLQRSDVTVLINKNNNYLLL